jgi:serine/threonine protein kinase/roadblock/LC7 domain-containing protein
MPLSPGEKLGPYEIVAAIGKGGMGEVYRAHDPRLGRDVAIKISSQRFDERFEREARAIAALNHPNICHVYDVSPDYLVMELIEGPTLKERIEEGAIPLEEAVRIAEQIAEALAAAHEKFITHRDLKPGNVKIRVDGTVKVLDFGLAKVGGTPTTRDSEDSPTFSLTLTQTGVILGTAAYMSPEQARGKPVDARADIWAFGVVLYEMLTARRLFRGADLTETLASVVKEEPDLSAVPRKVRRLLEACLQKDPKRRLQAIGDHHLLLAESAQQPTNWLWPSIAATIAIAAAAVSWVHFRETPPVLQSLRTQLTRPGVFGFAQFQLSPDGRYLAFIGPSSNEEAGRLFVRQLESGRDQEIPGTEGSSYPFWSPDSTHIAFFSRTKLRLVALAGGPATDLAPTPDGRGGTWAQDGTIVFAPAVKGGLSRLSMSSDGTAGPATPIKLPLPGDDNGDSLRFPTFLPDSEHFLYTIEVTQSNHIGTYVGSVAGGPPVRISTVLSITQFAPSPGSQTKGYILFDRDATLMAQPFDAASSKTTGEAFALAESLLTRGNTGYADFTVSSGGLLLYAADDTANQEEEIVWLDHAGKHGKSLLKQKGVTGFALSPNGTQLVYSTAAESIKGDLWMRDVARGNTQKFTTGTFDSSYAPVWSPDNSSVIFSAYPVDRLYRKAVSSAQELALTVQGTDSTATSWSTDGKLLAYSQTSSTTKADVWLLPLDQRDAKPQPFKQTPAAEREGQISPDGRWMAYTSDSSGRNEVYVESITPGGASHLVSVNGGGYPRWRGDGKELYFITSSNSSLMAVDIKTGPEITFGLPHELFVQPALRRNVSEFPYQPNADGSQFLMLLSAGGEVAAPALTVVTNWQGTLKK